MKTFNTSSDYDDSLDDDVMAFQRSLLKHLLNCYMWKEMDRVKSGHVLYDSIRKQYLKKQQDEKTKRKLSVDHLLNHSVNDIFLFHKAMM
ncbi:hypothetical protein FDP41_003384 [Naegleria fowleri]|uniref:Uncharacterized protein n=1 Tax=Naegleria fowleri TaxID=5763 RepID=A0A6A5BRS4_NAEFO|nr:uncharacterized protein FDP41_003384 [Naegleria fowleri]KAF0977392.1 hypothetical protein FDP41_003384 [Naegleria fowleri]CAG4713338.1 unnamed protein product [Naegleria fowleri]